MVWILNRLLMIAAVMAATACSGGSDDASPCPPNCGPSTATIVVEAGPEIFVFEGDTVTLSGSATHSGNLALQYQWNQVTGPNVVISPLNSPTATFIAPFVATREEYETMVFLLTVTDSDGVSGIDTVVIKIQGPIGVSGVNQVQGSAGSILFTGAPLPATLMSHVEIESNDTIETAAALLFPPRHASERIGTSVVGTIGNASSSKPSITDRSDTYILAPSFSGAFGFKLCRVKPTKCATAYIPEWRLSLRDPDSNELAYTSVGSLGDHSFVAYLDAGVPYYVSVTAADAVAGGDYKLSIISE